MQCHFCAGNTQRFGRNRNGSRRYRCNVCRRTFTDPQDETPDRRRLPREQAIACLRMLLEGNSLRSTARLTGISRNTILDTMVEAGEKCQMFLSSLRNLPASDVQVDELWAFVFCKERTRERLNRGLEVGDAWTFLAIERDTKFILASHVGKRTHWDAQTFVEKLRRVTGPARFQLSTDGFRPYSGRGLRHVQRGH